MGSSAGEWFTYLIAATENTAEEIAMSSTETLDMNARYTVTGYGGVAFHLLGYSTTEEYEGDILVCEHLGDEDIAQHDDECYAEGDYETIENTDMVRAVMVGDDREHLVDVSDLTVLADDAYCSGCGQVGCTADGRSEL